MRFPLGMIGQSIHRYNHRKKPFNRSVPIYYQPPKMKSNQKPHQGEQEKERRRAKRNG